MGQPLPGYRVVLLDPDDNRMRRRRDWRSSLEPAPTGLMAGYAGDAEKTEADVMRGRYYRTGDVARRDAEGYITWYVGRADDVFKASDYRISPFELESVLIEHPAVAEAAVVPSPDPVKLAVPKAFVVLASRACRRRGHGAGHPATSCAAS
jgi:acetyl-CoA synthetase